MERQIQERIFDLENKISELKENCKIVSREINQNDFEQYVVRRKIDKIKEWESKSEFLQKTLDFNKQLYAMTYKKFIL